MNGHRRKTCRECGRLLPLAMYTDSINRSHNHKTCSDCRAVRPWWVATARDKASISALCMLDRQNDRALAKKQTRIETRVSRSKHDGIDPDALRWCYALSDAGGRLTCALVDFPQWIAWERAINADTWEYPCVIDHQGMEFRVRWVDSKAEESRVARNKRRYNE